MSDRINTVYIFEAVDEGRQNEVAREKASKHPLGLVNVCYHRHGHSHNDKCYTLDINETDEKEETQE